VNKENQMVEVIDTQDVAFSMRLWLSNLYSNVSYYIYKCMDCNENMVVSKKSKNLTCCYCKSENVAEIFEELVFF